MNSAIVNPMNSSDAGQMHRSVALRTRFWHVAIRAGLSAFRFLMLLARMIGPSRRELPSGPLDVLITGTFHSHNWIEAHLRPLASSSRVRRVVMVAASPMPEIAKVEVIYPPQWLCRLAGSVQARMLQFLWTALSSQADVIGGFHLLFNGMLAAFLGRLKGAQSLYICGGGVQEVIDGGILSENRLFQKLEYADKKIERALVKAASECDLIITMGKAAIEQLQALGVRARFEVISGGRSASVFTGAQTNEVKKYDLIFVGRLAAIKRLDILLRALIKVKDVLPEVKAVFVGDGPLRQSLEQLTAELNLSDNVEFVGNQTTTHEWLAASKVFVLTSETEGLSLALMEATMSGLPAVVPDVGDLSELAVDGVSGFLVRERDPDAFATPILRLLTDEGLYRRMAADAKRLAKRFEVSEAAALWDKVLARCGNQSAAVEIDAGGVQVGGGN